MHVLIAPQRWPRHQPNAGGSTRVSAIRRSVLLIGSGSLNLSWNTGEQPVTINLVPSHY